MAVKASVDTQNQTTVRVGQQNAVKVTSTQSGISTAVSANTATNVVGGRADVTQLAVSGLSTFTGIGTFVSDLYVGGDLFTKGDLVLDNIGGSTLNITGIATIGSLVGDRVVFTSTGGKLESTPNLTYSTTAGLGVSPLIDTDRIDVSGNAGIGSLNVSGVSTFAGITTVTGDTLFTKQLSVSGFSTFTGIVTTVSDLYVGGDLYLTDDLVLDNITGNTLKITGLSTFSGVIDANDGINASSAKIEDLLGDRVVFTSTGGELESSPNLTYSTTTGLGVSPLIYTDRIDVSGNAGIGSLNVSGISTFAGITTVTGDTLFTKQLSVSGFSTYIGVATYKSNVFIDGTLTAGAIDGGTY